MVARTRAGPLVRIGGAVWLLERAPRLDPGASVRIRLGEASGDGTRPGRLLVVGGHRLEPPATVRLLPGPLSPPAGARPAPSGIEVAARLIGPGERPTGAPFVVRLSALAFAPTADAAPKAPTASVRPTPPSLAGSHSPAETGRGAIPSQPLQADGVRTLEARGIGSVPLGRVRLQLPGHRLEVQTPLALPLGARIQLRLPEGTTWPPNPAVGVSLGPGTEPDTPDDRPTAGEVRGEPVGERLGLPRPDHTLAARLLRLIAALGPADDGPTTEPDIEVGTQRAKPIPEPTRLANEPSGFWRALILPWGTPEGGQLRLLLPDDPTDEGGDDAADDARPEAARRAVFELELGQLGRLQLDALCRGRRFDLAVRSADPLEPGLRREIRALFQSACDLAGLTGRLDFRTHDLLELAEPSAPARHGLTV